MDSNWAGLTAAAVKLRLGGEMERQKKKIKVVERRV